MKKEYIKPIVEIIDFQPEDSIMDVDIDSTINGGVGAGGGNWDEED